MVNIFFVLNILKNKYIRFVNILIFQYFIRPCIGILHALSTHLLMQNLKLQARIFGQNI